MWPDRVSNLGHLAFESDALPTAPSVSSGHLYEAANFVPPWVSS